jgi:hypothetical protein
MCPERSFIGNAVRSGRRKKTRFKLVAVAGVDLKFYSEHLRKKELEEIAAAAGAELVLLQAAKETDEEIEVKE